MEEKKTKRIRRTRADLEKDILETVGQLVREKGFTHLTFMDVANASKTDINVLRRNFGSLDNLLDRYAHNIDYWLGRLLDENFHEKEEIGEEFINNVFIKLIDFIYDNEDMQRLLVWQTAVDNPTTRRISRNRDLYYKSLQENFYKNFISDDIPVANIMGLLIAGIYFLIIVRKRSTFCGVDYNKKQGREDMKRACIYVVKLLFDQLRKEYQIMGIARKMRQKGLADDLISECTGISVEQLQKLPEIMN